MAKGLHYISTIDDTDFKKKLENQRRMILDSGKTAEAEGAKIEGMFKRAGIAAAGYFTAQQALSFGQDIIRVRGERQMLEQSFEVLLQSRAKANKMIGEITQLAINSPLEMTPVANAAQTLLGFGVNAEKVMPIISQLSDVSMGNQQRFESLALVYAQIQSAGRLMGQDLLQLINAGFNPLTIIADQTGKSVAQLKDEMSKGAISADMVAEAFKSVTAEGGKFYQMTQKQADGIIGNQATFEDAIVQMKNKIGANYEEIIKGGYQAATAVVENYEEIGDAIMVLIATYGTYRAALVVTNAAQKLNMLVLRQAVVEKRLAAAAGIQLSSAEAIAASRTKLLTIAQQGLTKAIKSVGKAIMANPYALALAAIVALGYGIYKLVTYQTDAEKAQTKLNDAIKETDKSIDSEVHQIDSMFARLKNAKQGTDEYRAAKEAIMNRYGEYLKKLGDEKNALTDVAAAYKLITEEAKKAARARAMESFTKEAADTLAEKEGESKVEVRELLKDKYKGKKGADGISLSETYYWKIKPVIEGEAEIIPEIEKILKDFDKVGGYMQGGSPMFGGGTWVSTVSNKIKAQIEAAANARSIFQSVMSEAQMKFGENPNANAPEAPKFDATTASLQQLMEQLPKAKNELDALKKAEKPDPAAIAAKEQDIQQIKDQTAAREKSTTAIKDVKAQIELLQKEQEKYGKDDAEYKALETRIKSLKTKLPQTAGQTNKSETDAARVKREAAERNQKIQEYETEVKKQVKQSELDIAQARIDAMEDGFAKEQAQNDIAYQRLILSNQQREAQMVKALQDARELEWENKNPKAKATGETFVRSSVTAADLSPEQKNQLTEFYNVAEGIRGKANRDSLEQMLKEFGTYEQKKSVLITQWETKIAGIPEQFRAQARQDMSDSLLEFESQYKNSISSVQKLFSNFGDNSRSELAKIIADGKELLTFLTTAQTSESKKAGLLKFGLSNKQYKDLTTKAEELKVVYDAIYNAQEKLAKNDPFAKIVIDIKDGVRYGEDFEAYIYRIGEDLQNINQCVKPVIDSFGDLATALGIDSDTAGYATGMIGNMMTSMSAIMQGDWSTAIGSSVSMIASTINMAAEQQKEELEEAAKLLKSIIDTYDEIISRFADTIYGSRGQESLAALQKAQNAIIGATDETRTKGRDAASAWGFGYHSDLYNAKQDLKEYQESLASVGVDVNNLSGLFDMSVEQLLEFQETYPILWAKLPESIRNSLQSIIDYGEQLDDVLEKFRESVTQMSFDDAKSGLKDLLSNAETTMYDVADNIEDAMRNAVMSVIVDGTMSDKIQQWYADFANAMSDGSLSADEKESLQDAYGQIYQEAADMRDAAYEASGLPTESEDSREASKRGIATASQESVDENNGRLTAIQGHTFELNENVKLIQPDISSIRMSMDVMKDLASRQLQVLYGIQSNTEPISEMKKEIGYMRVAVETIRDKGILVKA